MQPRSGSIAVSHGIMSEGAKNNAPRLQSMRSIGMSIKFIAISKPQQSAVNPLREADVQTMESYTRKTTKALWEKLPILVYGLLRCELFGINW